MKISYEYLAGMIDGEGCVSFYKRTSYKRQPTGFSFTPYLTIGSTVLEHLEAMQEMFGGRIEKDHNGNKEGYYGKKPFYSLRWGANAIRELLPQLVPHLILKKQEALLTLEALELTRNRPGKPTKGTQHLRLPRLTEIAAQLKDLKQSRNLHVEDLGG